MKKVFKLMSLMLCMMAVSATFMACGDDKEEVTPSNGQPNASITAQDLLGTWYGIDENSDKKITIFMLELPSDGIGVYTEYKAKAEEDWEPYMERPMQISWTLSNGTFTMTAQTPGGKQSRVGDILSKTSDGSLKVRRHLVEGFDEITLYAVTGGEDAIRKVLENLLLTKKK